MTSIACHLIAAEFWEDPKTWTSIVAAFVALGAILTTYRWTIRHKRIDVTMHFQEAYDDLAMLRSTVTSELKAKHWFNRYWNLQIRQFEYWLHGYVRDEIYIYWMRCHRADYDGPREFPILNTDGTEAAKYDYRRGWEAVRDDLVFTEHPYHFREFVNHVLTCEMGSGFVEYIMQSKQDLFGILERIDRLTVSTVCDDPTKLYRLRNRR